MGEKLKNALRGHKEKKKSQSGGFSYMLASFIIHKRAWIETVFVIGCLLITFDDEFRQCKLRSDKIPSGHGGIGDRT